MKKFLILLGITVVCLINLSSCTSGNPLIGEWMVISYSDPFKATIGPSKVSPEENYILRFNNNGFFSFTTDCNTISGEFNISGKDLNFLNLSATEMSCDKEIVERSLKIQLPMVNSFDLTNDSILCLFGRQGNVLMELARVHNRLTNVDDSDD